MGISTTVLRLIVAGNQTVGELAEATGKPRKEIVKAAQVLKFLGYVHVCDALDAEFGSGARGMYFATEAGTAFVNSGEEIKPGRPGERPRQRTTGLRERAWWHYRAHKVASLKDLLCTHATGQEKAASVNLYKWLAALESVGILKRLGVKQKARQSAGRVLWSLEKDLGPQAPVWRQKAREVFDPNTGEVHPIPAREEGGHVQ